MSEWHDYEIYDYLFLAAAAAAAPLFIGLEGHALRQGSSSRHGQLRAGTFPNVVFCQAAPSITAQYRKELSMFVNSIINDDDVTSSSSSLLAARQQQSSWIGDMARSLALRSMTKKSFIDNLSVDVDTSNNKHDEAGSSGTKMKRKKKKNSLDNTTLIFPSSSTNHTSTVASSAWQKSEIFCMTCGMLLLQLLPTSATTIANTRNTSESFIASGNAATAAYAEQQHTMSLLSNLNCNIRLRSMKRGRTRRRRASRTKAKQLTNRTLSLSRRGGSNSSGGNNSNNVSNNAVQNDALLKEQMQHEAYIYCLNDGRAKNCLVFTCMYCGTKKKRKGMEISGDNTKTQQTTKTNKKTNNIHVVEKRKKINDKSSCTPPPSSMLSRENNTSSSILSTDYISLNTNSMNKRRIQDDNNNDNTKHDISPLLLMGKKKKKKISTPVKKGGDLMDFLSSLND